MQISHRIQAQTKISPPQFHLLVNYHLPSPFWEKNEFIETALIFKMTDDAISFLGRRNATQIKTLRHWKRLFPLSFFCGLFFLENIFLLIGSLMNSSERELKLSNHSPFCNHFSVSRIFQRTERERLFKYFSQ